MDEKTQHTDASYIERKHSLTDHEILGDNTHAKEDAMHYGHLSEEELLLEKKLRRRIDFTIMPMVVLVRRTAVFPIVVEREVLMECLPDLHHELHRSAHTH